MDRSNHVPDCSLRAADVEHNKSQMLPKGTAGVGGKRLLLWVQRRLEKLRDLLLHANHSSL